jgi:elongation factor G
MDGLSRRQEPDVDTLRALIRKGTLAMAFVPVTAGSAFKNKGVQPVLNSVIDYLPSPLDIKPYMGFAPGDETETRNIARSADDAQPFSALAFKIMNDPFVGSLTFTRIYSGVLKKGDQMVNSTKGRKERVGRMMMMHAINREEIDEGFRRRHHRAGRAEGNHHGRYPVRPGEPGCAGNHDLPRAGDRDRRGTEVEGRPGEDGHRPRSPGCRRPVVPRRDRYRIGPDHHEGHGRTSPRHPRRPHASRVQGRGEHRCAAGGLPRDHLARGGDRLYPQEADRRHGPVRPRQAEITPTEPGEGYSFESKIVGGAVPKEYIPGVEKGIKSVMDSGPLAGFPVIDFKVALVDGAFHDVDSSVLAFEIAARAAMREGLKKAGAKLLEPIMKVEVVTPEEYTGGVIGDLTSRRGMINGQDSRGNANVINAMVPLANMFGYINNLRSMSSGRAVFTMQFDHYDAVPQNISQEIQKKYA